LIILIYLDTNLIYKDPTLNRYVPLTPAAGQAILKNIGLNLEVVLEDERRTIIQAKNRDEAARPFERAFYKSLFLVNASVMLETTRLDGSECLQHCVRCDYSCLLDPPKSDFTKSGILFENTVFLNTLLVPAVHSYPVMDYALIGEKIVYLFQLTLGAPNSKIPSHQIPSSNVYSALYDYLKWESISLVTKDDPKYAEFKHKNFAECMLNSVLCMSDSQVEIQDKQLVVVNPVDWQVVYVIVTARELMKTGELAKSAVEFPWVRVLTSGCLRNLLGSALCDDLAKLCI